MNDKELKSRLNFLLFPDTYCNKCGCHQTWHGWWIESGDVRCHNCVRGIATANVPFFSFPSSYKLCYSNIFTLEDANNLHIILP